MNISCSDQDQRTFSPDSHMDAFLKPPFLVFSLLPSSQAKEYRLAPSNDAQRATQIESAVEESPHHLLVSLWRLLVFFHGEKSVAEGEEDGDGRTSRKV
jgi:hypothetical protein